MASEDAKTTFGERAFISAYIGMACIAMVGWLYAIGRVTVDVLEWMLS